MFRLKVMDCSHVKVIGNEALESPSLLEIFTDKQRSTELVQVSQNDSLANAVGEPKHKFAYS